MKQEDVNKVEQELNEDELNDVAGGFVPPEKVYPESNQPATCQPGQMPEVPDFDPNSTANYL